MMAPWDYNFRADSTVIMDYCEQVRLLRYPFADRRGTNHVIPNQMGENSDPDKYFNAVPIPLEVTVSETDSAGAVTHTNGRPGHIQENLDSVIALFQRFDQAPLLKMNDPEKGEIQRPVELFRGPAPSQNRFTYVLTLRGLDPFWSEATANNTNPVSGITNDGTAPIHDPIITFTGGTTPRLTNTTNGDYVEVGSPGGTPILVDCGAGTVTQGGSSVISQLVTNRDWWYRLGVGTNAHTLSGGGSASVEWRAKWF
jgi:hypothetical protein